MNYPSSKVSIKKPKRKDKAQNSNVFAMSLAKVGRTLSMLEQFQFLGEQTKKNRGRKTLVLDLDETLCHASTIVKEGYDFIVQVPIENKWEPFYVKKRPHLEEFLASVS